MAIHNDEPPTEMSSLSNTTASASAQNSHFSFSETSKMNKKKRKISCPSKLNEGSDVPTKRKVKKLKKKSKKTEQVSFHQLSVSSSTECEDTSCNSEIYEKDISQLRKVYKQCKSVIRKMELKYGDLLDSSSSDCTDGPTEKRPRLSERSQEDENDCQCTLNKKIVFDEDGHVISTIDTLPINHICPSKLMMNNQTLFLNSPTKNIKIECYSESTELSDNLQELRQILQDPNIDITYRNTVIEKFKLMRQIRLNEVRFNKITLIEKLKHNPDEVFHFSGSNLSTIIGYSA